MQKSDKYILGSFALFAFCAAGLYIFGAPTTGRQAINFGGLVAIALYCLCYGVGQRVIDFLAKIPSDEAR